MGESTYEEEQKRNIQKKCTALLEEEPVLMYDNVCLHGNEHIYKLDINARHEKAKDIIEKLSDKNLATVANQCNKDKPYLYSPPSIPTGKQGMFFLLSETPNNEILKIEYRERLFISKFCGVSTYCLIHIKKLEKGKKGEKEQKISEFDDFNSHSRILDGYPYTKKLSLIAKLREHCKINNHEDFWYSQAMHSGGERE